MLVLQNKSKSLKLTIKNLIRSYIELKVWQDKNSDGISQSDKWININLRVIKSEKLAA